METMWIYSIPIYQFEIADGTILIVVVAKNFPSVASS